MEEAGGEQGGRLVHRAGLFEQVARGALTQPRGEALGQPVAPGQLGEGRDDARVQPGGPAAHPPGGQRDPGQQTVPAGVRQPDLLLGDDPEAVIHSLCTLGGRGRDTALHLAGVVTATAQQQSGDPADAREHRADQNAAIGCRGHGHRRVPAPYEASGRRYVRVR